MKTCPDCGERVYTLGCTNCNEAAYMEEAEQREERRIAERGPVCAVCGGPFVPPHTCLGKTRIDLGGWDLAMHGSQVYSSQKETSRSHSRLDGHGNLVVGDTVDGARGGER